MKLCRTFLRRTTELLSIALGERECFLLKASLSSISSAKGWRNAADKLHRSRFIPMLNGVANATFEIPRRDKFAIISRSV